tara:strand:+ start:398 stop:622 length:225 start_codon:yes stop_codon:yes gene_type:complete
VLNVHRIVIPSSSIEEGVLIQADYTVSKNLVEIVKLRVHTIIGDIVGDDISEQIDLISHLFMTKLVESDLNSVL